MIIRGESRCLKTERPHFVQMMYICKAFDYKLSKTKSIIGAFKISSQIQMNDLHQNYTPVKRTLKLKKESN